MQRAVLTAFVSAAFLMGSACGARAETHSDHPPAAVGAPAADAGTAPAPLGVPSREPDQAVQADAPTAAPDRFAGVQMWTATSAAQADTAVRHFANAIARRTSSLATRVTSDALRFIGTPYTFGGTSSTSGFDCSGYVQHVFGMIGVRLPRTADAQYAVGHSVNGTMKAGDLVFFQTYAPGASHVGIYLGGGKFVHSAGNGVHVSQLHERYWAAHFIGAKRFLAQST